MNEMEGKSRINGKNKESIVSNTLNLAERASLAIHGMAGILDPKANYEAWVFVYYDTNPPYMVHDDRSFNCCGPKLLESFSLMRIMSGSQASSEEEEQLKKLLVSWIADDGLLYSPIGPKRPWDTVCPEDWANVYGQSRMMIAMMTLHEYDGDPMWLRRIGNMAKGLMRIAVDKKSYAYYPVNIGGPHCRRARMGERYCYQMGEGYCYPKSGWYSTEEAKREAEGTEGSMFMYHCGPIRALSRWYRMSGDKKAIQMATKLVNYVTNERFWGTPQPPLPRIVGRDRAHFGGHFHGHTAMLYALIEYASTVGDKHLKEFVRSGYEFARNHGIARVGLFGETCAISDMVAVAIRLSDEGIGDYWDDVDGYIRNQLIEQQFVDADLMRKLSQKGPPHQARFPYESDERVIERTIGIFCEDANLGQILAPNSVICCTGNGAQGLYYAWEGIIRENYGHAQVNLLLNRVSPWMDIESYLPYEGKVVLKNKTAQKLSLRLPNWVDRSKVQCRVDKQSRHFWKLGNYAILEGLKPQDEVVFTFPMKEETVIYTRQQVARDDRKQKDPARISTRVTCYFRGNTLVDLSPRPDERWYPIYQRDRYRKGHG